jgi:serine/threonine protein kinase
LNSNSKSIYGHNLSVGKVGGLGVTDFDYLKVLGKGAFGKVMLVRMKSTQAIFAMKILKMVDVIAQGQIKHAISEKEILRVIKHPFIVQLRFSFRSSSRLYLVTDYYSGDTLFFHLKKVGTFDENKTQFYGAEILSALAHLHSHKIIYRDLKLENILMDSCGHVSITDFGLSKQNVDFNVGVTTFCGSPQYVPPEILASYFNTQKKSYGPECDWWSFGILLYEMLIGKTPFFDKNRKIMFHRIMNVTINFPSLVSGEAAEIITKLLKRDPSIRLGAGENGRKDIFEHEFFKTIDFDKLNRREIEVPFVPNNNKFDLSKKSKVLLAEARDTISVLSPNDVKAFEGFSFIGEEPLDDERDSKYGR